MSRCTILFGQASVVVDYAFSRRVRALVARVGTREAKRLLGVSESTFCAAYDRGRMRVDTRDRLAKVLDVEVPATAKEIA